MTGTLPMISTPAPPLLGLLILLLGIYVAFDLGQRARALGAREGRAWLLAAAVALSTGLCASAAVGVAQPLLGLEVGFDAFTLCAAGLATFMLCFLGLNTLLAAAPSRREAGLAVAALGAATLCAHALTLSALGLAPGLRWNIVLLGGAWLCAGAGFACGQQLRPSFPGTRVVALRRLLSAAVTALAVLTAQTLSIEAAGLSAQTIRPSQGLVASATVSALASIGGAELLLLMLLASAVEARLRGRLEAARSALHHHAQRDELTGLPNRVAFESDLSRAQEQADAAQHEVALLLVALDGFKQVNEDFGHRCGDELLRHMARRLRELAPAQQVARLGGDEFLLLLVADKAAQQASTLAQAVLGAVAAPCPLDGRDVDISASIGVAVYPQHGAMSALITHASVAMRASKGGGGATYSIFDPRMVVDSREQAELLRDLRLALGRSQLELYFQPKVHAPSAQITGVEALLRWHHPTRGIVSPSVFIPLAERSGLINSLGDWVIDEACRQARQWRDQGLRMRVAVNLSAHQLRQSNLPSRIAESLRRHQINPDLLTCEITESVAMEDTDATLRFFGELAAVGVHISIDDFGSGYSSLAYLRKLPAGELKIDRAFVLDLEHSEEARKIAGAVVQLAQALKLKVVAEGVETDAQFQILRQLGCDELQGFLFAKPMSAKAVALWAMADDGPRTVRFSEALFQETQAMVL